MKNNLKTDDLRMDDLIRQSRRDYNNGFNTCKKEVLRVLEENKELESVSYRGKKVYKIYGTIIKKIKKL
jgi:(p)ppGpp synthase/HD superfamily hydrolase